MGATIDKSKKTLDKLRSLSKLDELIDQVRNKKKESLPDIRLPLEAVATEKGKMDRLKFLEKATGRPFPFLGGEKKFVDYDSLEGNIENFIGMSQVPTGIIGPVHVKGSAAWGDFYVPLATSEGALVASYHRGAKAARMAGGITSVCLIEGVQRSPVFRFSNMAELGTFLIWTLKEVKTFSKITSQTSRHAQLEEMKSNIEGNHLILTFEFQTGDASGQNMVTLCTDEICKYIVQHAPVKPLSWFIEGNYSGDKKATAISFSNVRGKKVSAEVLLPETVIKEVLKTSSAAMAEYWQTSTLGVIQSGAIGAQGHFANGLAALFIATGQDAACVSEAAVGITRMETVKNEGLYVCVTLPNLIVGTIGGGTGLPTQRECLELMECYGTGKARKFAEICGALVLSGEISIAAALSAGHFSSAHKKFGRKKKK
ncbi:MAG: hydroxymethylglutaryl-CoA reductase [Bacteroidota bacterium]